MRQVKPLSHILRRGSPKLAELRQRIDARERVLASVRAALPADLAAHVVSAGCESGRLTLGTPSSAWASRLRYVTTDLARRVGLELGLLIDTVRVRVVTVRK